MRYIRWALIAVVVLVVLVAATLGALPYLVDTARVQSLIATSASQALGRPVKFASLSVSVLPLPSIVLKNLEVAEDPAFGSTSFLRLNEAQIRLRLWPLLLLRVELGEFILKEPVISVIQNAEGRWNYATLGATQEARAPGRPRGGGAGTGTAAMLGSRVRIEKGLVTYETHGGRKAATYRVENLNLTLSSGLGPLAFQGDARVKPGNLTIRISDGTVGLNGARTPAEAPLRARLSLEGRDVRELVAGAMGPEPSIAGALKGVLTVGGTVGKPRAAGDIELSSLAVTQTHPQCPEPKRRTLALDTVKLNAIWEEPRFTARPLTTGLGSGSVATNVTATLDGGARVELTDIGVKTLPVEKLLVDFLCQGYAVTGPLDLSGNTSVRLGDLWHTLNGGGQLRLGPGKVVGAQALALLGGIVQVGGVVASLLGGDAPALTGASPLDYESVTGTYTITNGVVSTRDLNFTSRAIKASVAGTYGLASRAMNLDVVLTVARREIKAKVTGDASSPSIRVAPESILRDVDQKKIEKGLGDILKKFR